MEQEYKFANGTITNEIKRGKVQSKVFTPKETEQTYYPDENYTFNEVTVSAIPSKYKVVDKDTITLKSKARVPVTQYNFASIDSTNLDENNIRDGKTILGITGKFKGIVPSGNINITSSLLPTDVSGKATATIVEPNLSRYNIKKGINILGIDGEYTGETPIGNVEITNLDLYDVKGKATAQVIEPNLKDGSKIKDGETILGVVGTYKGIIPSGRVEINSVADKDVSGYATAYIDEETKKVLKDTNNIINGKTILGVTGTFIPKNITKGTQELKSLAEVNNDLKEKIKVDGTNIVESNIKKGVTILGIKGIYEGTGGIKPVGNKEITTSLTPTDVTNYATATIVDEKLKPEFIKNGESILGVVGNFKGTYVGEKSIDTLNSVDVKGYATAKIFAPQLLPYNVAKGVTILGVTGEYVGFEPKGEKKINQANVSINVRSYESIIVEDADLKPENIRKGYNILGVTGTYEGVIPSGNVDIYRANEPIDVSGYATATVLAPNLTEDVIALGTTILGVSGKATFMPMGTIYIDTLKTITLMEDSVVNEVETFKDIKLDLIKGNLDLTSIGATPSTTHSVQAKNLASANIRKGVNILGVSGEYEGEANVLQTKDVTPTKQEQTIVADTGFDALAQVNVKPIPEEYIKPYGTATISTLGKWWVGSYKYAEIKDTTGDLKSANIVRGKNIFGVTGGANLLGGGGDPTDSVAFYKANRDGNLPYIPLPSEIVGDTDTIYLIYDASGLRSCPSFIIKQAGLGPDSEFNCEISLYKDATKVGATTTKPLVKGENRFQFDKNTSMGGVTYDEYNYIVFKLTNTGLGIGVFKPFIKSLYNGEEIEDNTLIEVSGKTKYTSLDGGLFNKKSLRYFSYIQSMDSNSSFEFQDCTSLEIVAELQVKLLSMNGLFRNCYNLKSYPEINTKGITEFNDVHKNNNSLTFIRDYDTSLGTTFWDFAYGCHSLTKAPNLDLSSATNLLAMYWECTSLQYVPDANTSNVTSIQSTFLDCKSLKSIPNWDLSKVSNTQDAYWGCNLIEQFKATGMKKSFTLNWCPNILREQAVEIFNNLAVVSTPQTITLNNHTVARLSEEDKAIAIQKGWTVAEKNY